MSNLPCTLSILQCEQLSVCIHLQQLTAILMHALAFCVGLEEDGNEALGDAAAAHETAKADKQIKENIPGGPQIPAEDVRPTSLDAEDLPQADRAVQQASETAAAAGSQPKPNEAAPVADELIPDTGHAAGNAPADSPMAEAESDADAIPAPERHADPGAAMDNNGQSQIEAPEGTDVEMQEAAHAVENPTGPVADSDTSMQQAQDDDEQHSGGKDTQQDTDMQQVRQTEAEPDGIRDSTDAFMADVQVPGTGIKDAMSKGTAPENAMQKHPLQASAIVQQTLEMAEILPASKPAETPTKAAVIIASSAPQQHADACMPGLSSGSAAKDPSTTKPSMAAAIDSGQETGHVRKATTGSLSNGSAGARPAKAGQEITGQSGSAAGASLSRGSAGARPARTISGTFSGFSNRQQPATTITTALPCISQQTILAGNASKAFPAAAASGERSPGTAPAALGKQPGHRGHQLGSSAITPPLQARMFTPAAAATTAKVSLLSSFSRVWLHR